VVPIYVKSVAYASYALKKLTACDYESSQHRPFELRHFRESGQAFLRVPCSPPWLSPGWGIATSRRMIPAAPRPNPHRARADPELQAADTMRP
jgi:hypothetical protein